MTGARAQSREKLARTATFKLARAALLVVVVALAGTQSPAIAAEPQGKRAEAKVEFEKAQLHYRLGRFEEALQAYSRAYELFSAPALLFNIGQCHKNLQNHERAIFFFEGYLREETNPEKRALAAELIAVSRGELERRRNEPPKVDPLASTTPPGAEAATGPPSVAAPVPLEVAPEPTAAAPVLITSPAEGEPNAAREERPLYGRWWFWTAIGVGAAVATGAAIYYGTAPTSTVPPSGSAGTLDRRR